MEPEIVWPVSNIVVIFRCLALGRHPGDFLSRTIGLVVQIKALSTLIRFQKDLRPHLSFSYRFRPSTIQRRSRGKPRGSVCPPFWILTVEWSGARSCLFLMTSPFSDSIVSSVHTRKQRFQKASFLNRSTLESVFEWLRFR